MTPPVTPSKPKDPKERTRLRPPAAAAWMITLLVLFLVVIGSRWFADDSAEIKYTFFHKQLQARNIKSLEIRGQKAYGEFVDPPLSPTTTRQPADHTGKNESQAEKAPRRLPKNFFVNLLSPEVDAELRKALIDAKVDVTSR